jgi:tRNA threonylcarbamoyladenosine biosynthesis protein TsaB
MSEGDPLVLAIESATAQLSVALVQGDRTIALRRPALEGHHAERILPLLDALFADAGRPVSDVDAIGVSIGPGSFTSLRVGLATAKGVALGSGRPIVAVPTLEALAFGALAPGDRDPVAALLDARRGEVYAAIFVPEVSALRVDLAEGLFAPAELAPHLPSGCRLVGEGALLYGEELRRRAGGRVVRLEERSPEQAAPDAGSVGRLAIARLLRNETAPPDLAPRYVRRAEAEVTRTARSVEEPV